jgi:hypothetical protein
MMHLLIYRDQPIGIYSSSHKASLAADFFLADNAARAAEYIEIRKLDPDKILDIDIKTIERFRGYS